MMTRAALYARRSREEHQYSSTDVQVEQGLAFIAETDPSLLFVEREKEASRAEFKKRRDLIAMLDAAKRGEFQLLEDLRAAGVRVFHYFTGEEVVFDNATAKLIVTIKNYSSEREREKISQRTHKHLLTKARAGRVVGGRVYGYENVPVMAGERLGRVPDRRGASRRRAGDQRAPRSG